jgi:putative CocE/NonD family hydrolase
MISARRFAFLFACTWMWTAGVLAQYQIVDSTFLKENYTKQEVMIPMRDGIRLFTTIYAPKDTTRLHPILLTRTPYSCAPYGEEVFPKHINMQDAYYYERRYIRVFQDVRGRYMSEGTFEDVRPYIEHKKSNKDIDESSDTYDTVDWLVRHVEGNNGNVGIKGISYPGFYTWMGAIDAHPAVKAVSPQAPVSEWMGGDDWFHNGAFLESHAFSFYAWFGWPRTGPTEHYASHFHFNTPDGYDFFLKLGALRNANLRFFHDSVPMWNTLLKHGTWDQFWSRRSILPHLKNIKPAVLVVGGWFDTENLFGTLHSYEAAVRDNPKNNICLAIGPWAHGWWTRSNLDSLGAVNFDVNTTRFYTYEVEGPFLDYYLRGRQSPQLSETMLFITGLDQFRLVDQWPPKRTDPLYLYLGDDGRLTSEKPAGSRMKYDQYISDPEKPAPYTAQITQWYNPAFMDEDQRFAARRPDVLVYQTAVLDSDITIAGPIDVHLVGSTSGTDCDWVVKVIDVFPDTLHGPAWTQPPLGGYEMLVRGDVLRGKFRKSLSHPIPFVPNRPTDIDFSLQDVFHMFRQGHRIMVQIQSSWFPMIDRNPGKFLDIYTAKDSDFKKTTQRVYHSAQHRSWIKVNTWQVPPLLP